MDGVAPDDQDGPAEASAGPSDPRWEDDTDPIGFPPVTASGFDSPVLGPGRPGEALPGWPDAAVAGETEPEVFIPGLVRAGESSAERTGPVADRPLGGTSRRRVLAVVVLVALLGAVIVTVGLNRTAHRGDSRSATPAGPGQPAAPSGTPGSAYSPLTGPRQGRQAAVFQLADGVSDVRVRAADLGGDLYRVSVPAGSGLAPRIEQNGDEVRLLLSATGKGGARQVEVALNVGVRWTLRLDGGVDRSVIDMTGGSVAGVELGGGASRIDLTLPRPLDQLLVRMTGGVNQFVVHLVGRTPVRVRVQAGAGHVTLGGATHYGIAPGRSFTANGWAAGAAGVDLQAVAGMAALDVLE
jgi:hypothetical protein